MRKLSIVFAAIFMVLFTSKCENYPLVDKFYAVTIVNNDVETIYFYMYDKFSIQQYPDTSLPAIKPSAIKILASKKFYVDSREPWQNEIGELNADTLSIFFFSKDTYIDSSWGNVSSNYSILKRYDLSIEDLERLDFNILYPPNQEMDDIQMFPN